MKNLSNSPYNNSLPLNDENIELIAKDGIKGWFDQGFTWLVYTFAGMTVAVLFVMSWIVFQEARPAIAKFGIKF